MVELNDSGRLWRAFLLLSPLFILLLFYPNLTIPAEDIDHHQYYSGYTGSLASDPRNLTRTYFENPNLQNLIREIADRGPVSAKRVQQALSGTAYTVDDLLRVKLLRQDEQLFRIGFNFFTAADMQLVASAAEKYVPSLVQGYLASKEKFARIFSHYPIKSVESDKVAFVLIAGFSLNWDALRITEKTALRKPLMVEGDGWKYTFF